MRKILIGLVVALLSLPAAADQQNVVPGTISASAGCQAFAKPCFLPISAGNPLSVTIAGGGDAVTIADCADVALGCVADVTWSGSGSGTVVATTKYTGTQVALMSAKLPASLGAKTGATSLSVVPASDATFVVTQSTAASLNATVVGTGTFATQAAQSGTWNIATLTTLTGITNALPAGSNVIGHVIADTGSTTAVTGTVTTTSSPTTSGGVSTFSQNITTAGAGAGTGGVAVDASAGQVYGYALWNGNSSVCYIQFFDVAQATVNLGTTAPKLAIGIPALGGANVTFPIGVPFATAITVGVTTTRAGSTACSTGIDVNLFYK